MLDHISENFLIIGDFGLLDASSFDHFNYTIKAYVRITSMRKGTSMEEAVEEIIVPVQNKSWRARKTFKIEHLSLQGMASV